MVRVPCDGDGVGGMCGDRVTPGICSAGVWSCRVSDSVVCVVLIHFGERSRGSMDSLDLAAMGGSGRGNFGCQVCLSFAMGVARR